MSHSFIQNCSFHITKDEKLVSKMKGKTNYSRRLLEILNETFINIFIITLFQCLDTIDVGCNLKQFDGLT